MTNTHTPGPWECSGIAIMVGGHCIATCDTEAANTSDEMDENNARLIAAAPDLLEALTAALQDWRADFMQRGFSMSEAEEMMACREGYDLARAAIAKATGDA